MPSEVSELFDQTPPLRDPKRVLTEIEAAEAPDNISNRCTRSTSSSSACARRCCKRAAGRGVRKDAKTAEAARPATRNATSSGSSSTWSAGGGCRRIWAAVYVWNNSPAFMLYVVKDGKPSTPTRLSSARINYATPVFTADMKTIVFNPDWIAPETVVKENIGPHFARGTTRSCARISSS